MNEQENNTGAAFMEVTSKKVEMQDKNIAALDERINSIPDNTEEMKMLISMVEELRNDVQRSRFPIEKVQDFAARLDLNNSLLKMPLKKEIVHQHHVPKLIWISAGLFIALALVCSGWYMTAGKLDGYIASDTKYRMLRLDTSQVSLQRYLNRTDSLYNAQPDIRKTVLETEEKNRENFELKEKANRLRQEARDLERAAKK